MKKILLVIFPVILAISAYSQQDMQLAMQYFNSKEYEKAEPIFEKLYKQRKATFYFDYYVDCLIFQEKFKDAEKKIKKEINKNPNDYSFKITLGYLYRSEGKDDDAEKQYKNVYKNLPQNKQQIITIGNTLIRRKEYNWAEKVYEKGDEYFEGEFTQSLAMVYAYERKYDLMIEKYLDYVANDYTKKSTVQNIFLNYLKNDVNNEFATLLEHALIVRIQTRNSNQIFEELLIWYYLQKNNFSSALIYAKSLDKRNKENGVRVYKVGQAAQTNDNLNIANKSFQYVVDKGTSYPYYNKARFALLKVMYQQVTNREITSEDELEQIENQYLTVINELSISNTTLDLIVDLAHLQGFYLNKEQNAITLLKQALAIPRISNDFKSKLLLELGDVYLHANMPWDAALTYGKIETQFQNLQITDEAKFRKAKTYFYLGQFEWAQGQWEVLEGSPSKLIANDAIYWSNFAKENIGSDSTYSALKVYARADFALYTSDFNKAILTADSLIQNFSSDPIIPYAYHLKYDIFMQTKEYQKAAASLQNIVDGYAYAMWADKAVFELAQLYDNQLNMPDKAAEMYKKILFDFQGSIFTDKARERYRELKGV